MLHYYKFKEGAPKPEERHNGEEVVAEDVELQDASEAALKSIVGLSETERLMRVRRMELPPTYDEDRWREIRDTVPVEVFDMMHNEAVQRQIKSGHEWNAKHESRPTADSDEVGRANETFEQPAADDEVA